MPADYLSDDIDTEAAYHLYAESVCRYEPNDGLTEEILAIMREYAPEWE